MTNPIEKIQNKLKIVTKECIYIDQTCDLHMRFKNLKILLKELENNIDDAIFVNKEIEKFSDENDEERLLSIGDYIEWSETHFKKGYQQKIAYQYFKDMFNIEPEHPIGFDDYEDE